MKFNSRLVEFFALSKNERRGATVLIGLIVLVAIFRFLVPFLFHPNEVDESINHQVLAQLLMKNDSLDHVIGSSDVDFKYAQYNAVSDRTIQRKSSYVVKNQIIQGKEIRFDPNQISLDAMIEMGFSEKLAHTIINYREKGGKFYKAGDLLKIYGIDSIFFDQLLPLIEIKSNQTIKITQVDQKIELNSADTTALKTLPGIGSTFAKRICGYRGKLGGFYSVDQLSEVYGMKPETLAQIKNMLTVNQKGILKIDINFADYRELIKHPYMDKLLVKKIINFRNQQGSFKSIDQLLIDSIISPELYDKLTPYLKINE